ncbi:MAG: NUDIX domain-containing protein [Clostridia bacterium]|nr:NUDIX domain-containing protein [Clostridia bacterium]
MEVLDVLDEEGKETGKIEDKDIIHEKGLWHKEAEAWLVNEKGEILIQKRAPTKKQRPNKWTITEGHVKSGENEEKAVLREIKEEIGIDCKKEDLELIIVAKHSSIHRDNNTFRYTYYCKTDKKIEEFTMQKEEVSELKYITLQELKQFVEKQDDVYTFSKWEYIQDVIKYLEQKAKNL